MEKQQGHQKDIDAICQILGLEIEEAPIIETEEQRKKKDIDEIFSQIR